MIYLASPYSHQNPDMMQRRYEAAAAYVAKHMNTTPESIFSPIVHCHYLAKEHNLPKDHEFWLEFNREFIQNSDELWILAIEGWTESKGVKQEVDWARELHIPVRYIHE